MWPIARIPGRPVLPRRPELGRRRDDDRAGAGSDKRREPGPGRSLVALGREGCEAERPGCYSRPAATFLAHLIATAQQAPQTRQRRRAEPQDAAALYASAAHAASGGKHRLLI
jgi:hypothetical protein